MMVELRGYGDSGSNRMGVWKDLKFCMNNLIIEEYALIRFCQASGKTPVMVGI